MTEQIRGALEEFNSHFLLLNEHVVRENVEEGIRFFNRREFRGNVAVVEPVIR